MYSTGSPGAPPPETGLRLDAGPSDQAHTARRERSWPQLQADLATLSAELVRDLSTIPIASAGTPSLCAGWSVRDVVVHFIVGDEIARRSLGGENCFPDPTDDEQILQGESNQRVVDYGPVDLPSAVEILHRERSALLAAMSELTPAQMGVRVPWAAQSISRFALVQSRLMETWFHGWDIRCPLGRAQPVDDRTWWVSDMGVRHLPYGLAKQGLAAGTVPAYQVELAGPGGGSWSRELVPDPAQTATVTGPSWAWLIAISRREVAQDAAWQQLQVAPAELTGVFERSVRAFA